MAKGRMGMASALAVGGAIAQRGGEEVIKVLPLAQLADIPLMSTHGESMVRNQLKVLSSQGILQMQQHEGCPARSMSRGA
ncbi:hypothetical protein ACMD2_25365 [Ananas comosus]|uniref:Uncharacterized protein n=1 Tax=Ananas comosus TaxID=4615 RepID=A0A199UWP3_ANACO|nr:hypothetical protein ACMD2_25365 [Ananas comosus]